MAFVELLFCSYFNFQLICNDMHIKRVLNILIINTFYAEFFANKQIIISWYCHLSVNTRNLQIYKYFNSQHYFYFGSNRIRPCTFKGYLLITALLFTTLTIYSTKAVFTIYVCTPCVCVCVCVLEYIFRTLSKYNMADGFLYFEQIKTI